jgi:hypothetical protein
LVERVKWKTWGKGMLPRFCFLEIVLSNVEYEMGSRIERTKWAFINTTGDYNLDSLTPYGDCGYENAIMRDLFDKLCGTCRRFLPGFDVQRIRLPYLVDRRWSLRSFTPRVSQRPRESYVWRGTVVFVSSSILFSNAVLFAAYLFPTPGSQWPLPCVTPTP